MAELIKIIGFASNPWLCYAHGNSWDKELVVKVKCSDGHNRILIFPGYINGFETINSIQIMSDFTKNPYFDDYKCVSREDKAKKQLIKLLKSEYVWFESFCSFTMLLNKKRQFLFFSNLIEIIKDI